MRILLIMLALMVPATMIAAEQTLTMKVSGNCGSCKKKIVRAAEKVDGVSDAGWDKKTKVFTATYDDDVTTKKAISAAILAAGYDVEGVRANDKAYNKLPDCCQYRDDDDDDDDDDEDDD